MLCLTTDTILVHQSSITSACNEIKPDELLGQRGKATESKGPASIGFSPDTYSQPNVTSYNSNLLRE